MNVYANNHAFKSAASSAWTGAKASGRADQPGLPGHLTATGTVANLEETQRVGFLPARLHGNNSSARRVPCKEGDLSRVFRLFMTTGMS